MTRRAWLVSLLWLGLAATRTDADLIALWNFNDAANSDSSAANVAALFSVDRGAGTMTSNFLTGTITAFAGTTINAQGGDPAGQALALRGGLDTANNGSSVTFSASTLGFDAVKVSFASQATSTGFNDDQFQYSTDGVTFTSFGATFAPPASFALFTFDLSGISGLDDNPNAAFRIVFDGSTNGNGNNRIDNLLVAGTAIPEPGTLALVLLSAGAGVVFCRRRSRS